MKQISLFIDTTERTKTIVALRIDGEGYKKEIISESNRNQQILPLVISLCEEQHILFTHITNIEVNPGPGSFTGVRVGVSIANALSYALAIPVNGKLFGKTKSLVEPVYSS